MARLPVVADRVGDYVHCMGRLVNTVALFLTAAIPQPQVRACVRRVVEQASAAAHHAQPVERLAASSMRPKVVDLTTALYLARSAVDQGRIVEAVRDALIPVVIFRGNALAFHNAILLLFRCLGNLLQAWSQEEALTQADLVQLEGVVSRLGDLWTALGWRVTPWVHWTIAGSCQRWPMLVVVLQRNKFFVGNDRKRDHLVFSVVRMALPEAVDCRLAARPPAGMSGCMHDRTRGWDTMVPMCLTASVSPLPGHGAKGGMVIRQRLSWQEPGLLHTAMPWQCAMGQWHCLPLCQLNSGMSPSKWTCGMPFWATACPGVLPFC